MSLHIECGQKVCQDILNNNYDNYSDRVHIRASQEGDEYYIGISNAKPEGQKNGPGYTEVGFYIKKNGLPITENFVGRNSIIPIEISAK